MDINYKINPYKDDSANVIYNLLFCDNINLYRASTEKPYTYPFDVLFADNPDVNELQKLVAAGSFEARIKLLAYNRLQSAGIKPEKKELLAVIVEVALDEGLDTLASFIDGAARYINHSERIIIWETTTDATANAITTELFQHSLNIVNNIGPWDAARKDPPAKGNLRISFLVSDGLYFGEGPMNALFNDAMAAPALTKATELMQFLISRDK